MGTIPNGHEPEWTQSRMDTIWSPCRMDTTLIDTILNEHSPAWTQSQVETIPNECNPERTLSEWTQFRMNTYVVTEVLYTYSW